MSILDVTEDQIFHTLGRGRDPNFKPIEKVRPHVVDKPKKTYTINRTVKPVQVQQAVKQQPVQVEHATTVPQFEDIKKLTADLSELNNRVAGLQKMVKWYVVPQFVVILVLFLTLVVKS